MEGTSKRRRKVLYDLPVSNDAFSGGGHQRTAASLANTIQEFDDQTRSIGLEGKWGSGKSTIVEIAKSMLDAANKGRRYHVFTFDLWTNQNSIFRRAFLESFLSWLEGIDGSKSSFVEMMRDKIRDRTVDTRTTNVKVFSGFGLIVIAFLLILPWLYMWLSPFALKDDTSVSILTKVASILVASMFLMTVVVAMRTYFASKKISLGSKLTWAGAFSSTLSVFSKDAQTVHIKQNIREVDPTQNEFELTLKEILSSFQTENRRIIIVFDNIDRLPSEKIVEAWSDIRSVLSSSRQDDGATKKLTAIVPYDRHHILRALYAGSDINKVHQDDVFRKSFDAIFFVAPPVVSDSVDFFNSKLEEALGTHFDRDAAYRVFKIFDLSRADEAATPRQVIAFINSIATLWEQWGDLIPLPTIAVFMLHRDDIDRKPEMLRKEDSIDARYRELSDDVDLFKNLAALAFNVQPHLAFQILLHNRIEQIFTSDDSEAAKELTASPGFEVILPEVYAESAQRWAAGSLTQFKFAARNLASIEKDRPSTSQSKRKMLEAIQYLQDTPSAEWEKSHDLLALYGICTSPESDRLTASLADWLLRCLPGKEDDRKFVHGQQWASFIGKMFTAYVECCGPDEVASSFENIPFPSGDEFLLGAAYEAEPANLSISMFKQARASSGLITPALDARLTEQPDEFFYAWPQIRHLTDSSVIPGFIEKLATQLTSNDYLADSHKLRYLVGNLNMLFEDSDKKGTSLQSRKTLVTSGSLFHGLYGLRESSEEDAIEARAAALWTVLDHFRSKLLPPGDLHHPSFGSLNEARDFVQGLLNGDALDPATLDILVDQSIRYDKVAAWITTAAAAPGQTGLLQQIVTAAIVGGKASPPSVKVFVAHYDFLKELLGDVMEQLLVSVGSDRDAEEFKAIDFSVVPTSLVTDAAGRQELGWKEFFVSIDSWLRGLESSAWQEALANDGHMLKVLRSRVRTSGFTAPPNALRAPVAQHTVAILTGEMITKESFDDLVEALPLNNRDGLASDVLERLAKASVTAAGFDSALASYPSLLAKLPFDNDPETTVSKIVIPAIQSGSHSSIGFLDKHNVILRKTIKAVSDSLVGQVQEFIGMESADDGEASLEHKRRLRQILDLPAVKAAELEKDADKLESGREET